MKISNFRYIGYAVAGLSFYYLIKVLLRLNIDISKAGDPFLFIVYTILFSFGYVLLIFVTAFAWKKIFEFSSRLKVPNRDAFKIYAQSNIAKYLPGNVLHLVGRNYLGFRLGWKHSEIALSSLLEMGFVIMTVGICSSLLFFANYISLPERIFSGVNLRIFAVYAIVLIMAVSAFLVLYKIKRLPDIFVKFYSKKFLFFSIRIFLTYSFVFLSAGFIFAGIFHVMLNVPLRIGDNMSIIGTFIVSWFLGFIIPGVPGGIGVRELSMVLMLSPLFGENTSLIAALLFRGVTVLGEVIAFLIAAFLCHSPESPVS